MGFDPDRTLRSGGDGARAAVVTARAIVIAYGALLLAWMVAIGGRYQGFEAEAVARSLLAGHGFAFPIDDAWLFWNDEAETYVPTAWVDPLQTLIHAAALGLLGEQAGYAILTLAILATAGAAWILAGTAARHLHPLAAPLAVLVLLGAVAHTPLVTLSASLAMLGVSLLLRQMLEARRGWRAAACTGGVLGFTLMLWSALQPWLLLVPGLWGWRTRLRDGVVVGVVALAVVTPWMLRNVLVFDTFVPFRTGGGQILHLGTVGLGGTIAPQTVVDPPPWQAATAFEAVTRVLGDSTFSRDRARLEAWQHERLRRALGNDPMANEAERDAWLRREALAYILENPGLTAALGVAKLWALLVHTPGSRRLAGITPGAVAAFLALLALLPWRWCWRARLVAAVPLLAYGALFVLITPYFYRYRMPVEPLVAFLAAATLMAFARRLRRGPTTTQ